MESNLPHWLQKQAELNPHEKAIETDDGSSLSFLELHERSKQYAAYFEENGIQRGDHVAVLSSNRLEMVLAIHALSYLGAVVVLLNTRLTPEELAFQIKDAEVSCLITEENFYSKGEAAIRNAGLAACPIVQYHLIQTNRSSPDAIRKEITLDEVFTIIYTSGTTGSPKGVQLTYGNHWASAISSALNLGLSQSDKWLICLPMFHVGGFSALIKNVVYGMPVFLMERFDEHMVNHAIKNSGVTIVSVVSIMLQRLIENLRDERLPAHFRCMLLGGGPAPKPLLENAKDKAIPVFQTYGMTETASQIVTLSPKDALRKLGSAGRALSTAWLVIDAPRGEIGEIKVKGPMVTKGYYKRDESTTEALSDGWLATGDLGYQDEEGFLYVVDRRKDLIISGGENIYPAEIESVLSGMKGIMEAGVTGIEDQRWGQVPAAFVVTQKESVLNETDVLRYCRDHLAGYKCPKEIHFVEKLPRNASNKLLRRELPAFRKDVGN
ncbi:O-succinylbenzoic acid--CoA ligase [Thalassobacillus cyri]|uniref:2-succinylbenzoate--CoA ligase n=1 Tax=Thalassobacillus cyri TaxID=571932 RepID=A0A1H4G680_9BACI|nr:o-succinylbenzoate--CoA ligase [Thalassobacillus cyri]SEB04937.1 O-succinylbenzoic acid--CoA ligase [Thalassobacillus cyri]